MIVAGIDGTKKGWVVVTFDGFRTEAFGVRRIADAIHRLPNSSLIAVDMPIGFRDAAEPGGRECETLARVAMPGRASSVFSSPCRMALLHSDYALASSTNRSSSPSGVGLSKQSHAIFPKMTELDAIMTPELQRRVFEVHPELSFTALARTQGKVIEAGKKMIAGSLQRTALLEAANLQITALRDSARSFGAAEDDILDAAVGAWTAHRRHLGEAYCLPSDPPVDSRGLRMEMWV